jgi:hypothetical protein
MKLRNAQLLLLRLRPCRPASTIPGFCPRMDSLSLGARKPEVRNHHPLCSVPTAPSSGESPVARVFGCLGVVTDRLPPHGSFPAYRPWRNTDGRLPQNGGPSWENPVCRRSPRQREVSASASCGRHSGTMVDVTHIRLQEDRNNQISARIEFLRRTTSVLVRGDQGRVGGMPTNGQRGFAKVDGYQPLTYRGSPGVQRAAAWFGTNCRR